MNSDKTDKTTEYKVLYGDDMSVEMLGQIMDIDKAVYEPIDPGFVGTLENMQNRFVRNKRSFVCLLENDTIIAYVNFFPVCDRLFDQLLGPIYHPAVKEKGGYDEEGYFTRISSDDENDRRKKVIEHYKKRQGIEGAVTYDEVTSFYNTCRDDDIRPDEIEEEYHREKEKNNLFILSVAIHPDHRGKNTSVQLTNAFIDYLKKLDEEGCGVNSISAICVSDGGEKFLRGLNFYFFREIGFGGNKTYKRPTREEMSELVGKSDALGSSGIEKDYHERVYLCWGYYLDRLINGRLYHKTHKDDIFLFVPLADNPENTKIDELLMKAGTKECFYYNGIIPGSDKDPVKKKQTMQLLDNLQYYMDYEYDGFIKDELERIYLGECLFRHMTDRYVEDDTQDGEVAVGETVGEEKADLLLLAYRSANMYVLVIYLPGCRFSSSMAGDQLSKMKLEMRSSVDELGFYGYESITGHLMNEYNLVVCGVGKAFYCMNKRPESKNDQEMRNILTGETYFSVHQDFYIKNYEKLDSQLNTDLAIYDYYKAYMSPVSLVMILDTFDDADQKVEDAATYVFIVELVLLQNTALNKLSRKVGIALEHEGNVPYEYISHLYKDYGRTLKLWDSSYFKYYGTRMEAEQIRKAFENDELKEKYEKEQDFLENIVEVNSANDERRNGWILGIVGTVLALFQIQDYIIGSVKKFYIWLGDLTGHSESIIPQNEEQLDVIMNSLFNCMIWGAIILFVIVYFVNSRRRKYEQKLNLHSEKEI